MGMLEWRMDCRNLGKYFRISITVIRSIVGVDDEKLKKKD